MTHRNRIYSWALASLATAAACSAALAAEVPAAAALNVATNVATPDAPVEGPFSGASPQLELIAGKDEKRAVISLGHTSTNGLQWVAKLSSPWDDKEDEGVPASLDGLANGIKLELSLTGLLFKPPELAVASLDAACDAARVSVGDESAECDDRLYDRVRDRAVRQQVAKAYFGERPWSRPLIAWSVNASAGSDEFKTVNLDLSEDKNRKSASAIGFDLR